MQTNVHTFMSDYMHSVLSMKCWITSWPETLYLRQSFCHG